MIKQKKKTINEETDVVQQARSFWVEYNKPVMYVSVAVIALLTGWVIYKYMFQIPKAEKADEAVFMTQKYFSDLSNAPFDSSRALLAAKVINGDGVNPGALKIISRYPGTDAANLCHYYAGASYLHLGQFAKAIEHLEDFDANGATQIKSRALGMLGDASAELKKNDQALEYYKKAATANKKDDYTSSEYLFRAALFANATGKTNEAIDLFKEIKEEYPLSEKAAEVDRYLARLGEFSE